jgi:hypothetical protein
MSTRISIAVAVLIAACLAGSAFARPIVLEESAAVTTPGSDRSTATTVWFQGFLADDVTGDPVNATYDMVARIYSAAGGGVLLWGPETHGSVVITEGWFNIELGSVLPPLPSFASPPYYLSLQVNGEYLAPRLKLASVPSAIQSATSDLLPFSGYYSGSASEAFFVGSGSASGSDGISASRWNGTDGAFAVYAASSSPEAAIRGYQSNTAAVSGASVLLADISNAGNDSPVIDGYTTGAGPVYWGMTDGLYGLEIYADASDAPADSMAHVIHAVYNGELRNSSSVAVYGEALGIDVWGAGGQFVGSGYGVVGEAVPPPTGSLFYYGVAGTSTSTSDGLNVGVYGTASGGYDSFAGAFDGDVDVVGTLTKDAGSFKIDHPLDPASKYLSHSFVESPDMKNIYDGVAVLDASGEALVGLPDWFEALNQDFRYQLTCIGAFAPVYVADEISGNRFRIAGGEPGMKVSWQVTGIRHDPYADAHRIPVEEVKSAREQGRYRNPELYGAPESAGVRYDERAKAMRSRSAAGSHGRERPEAPDGVDPAQQ